MCPAAATRSLLVDTLTQQRQTECISLAYQQFADDGRCIACEGQLVGMVDVALPFNGQEHRTAVVYHQLAAEIGLLLETFDEELVGTGIEFPVDALGRLACRVLPMLGELYRETMKWTSMHACDESLHHLACIEV